jgi:hypothetical protein
VVLVIGKQAQVQLRVARCDLGFQLGHRGDLAVLAQVDRLRITQRDVVVADLALLFLDQLLAFRGVGCVRVRDEGEEGQEDEEARSHRGSGGRADPVYDGKKKAPRTGLFCLQFWLPDLDSNQGPAD